MERCRFIFGLRVGKVESNPGGRSSDNPKTNKVVKELQSAVNKLDPALRRVAFIGWPENVSAEKRVELCKHLVKKNIKNSPRRILGTILLDHATTENYRQLLG